MPPLNQIPPTAQVNKNDTLQDALAQSKQVAAETPIPVPNGQITAKNKAVCDGPQKHLHSWALIENYAKVHSVKPDGMSKPGFQVEDPDIMAHWASWEKVDDCLRAMAKRAGRDIWQLKALLMHKHWKGARLKDFYVKQFRRDAFNRVHPVANIEYPTWLLQLGVTKEDLLVAALRRIEEMLA